MSDPGPTSSTVAARGQHPATAAAEPARSAPEPLRARWSPAVGVIETVVGLAPHGFRVRLASGVSNAHAGKVGWSYRLVGANAAARAANLRWLAGYRHPRHAWGSHRRYAPSRTVKIDACTMVERYLRVDIAFMNANGGRYGQIDLHRIDVA